MLPPEWVTESIERIDPWHRLAWMGGEFDPEVQYRDLVWPYLLPQAKEEQEDETNVGQFYILRLFHARDAARAFHTPWNKAGPIFGSRYDPLGRTPFIIQPVTKRSVFNGAAVRILRDMLQPWEVYAIETAKKSDSDAKSARADLYGEMGDRLWHRANSAHGGNTVLSRKFVDDKQKKVLVGEVENKLDTYHQDMLKR